MSFSALKSVIVIFLSSLICCSGSIVFGGLQALIAGISPSSGRPVSMGRFWREMWASWILSGSGVRVEVSGPGLSHLQSEEVFVVVMNHQSAIDIFSAIRFLGRRIVFLAKKELFYIPIFGLATWISGVVFLDRSKGVKDKKALSSIQAALKAGNCPIIYPEGTRSKDGALGDFKRGAFVLAIEHQVPILPVTINNAFRLMKKGSLKISPGTVNLYIHEPVATTGLSLENRHQLAIDVRQKIQDQLDRELS